MSAAKLIARRSTSHTAVFSDMRMGPTKDRGTTPGNSKWSYYAKVMKRVILPWELCARLIVTLIWFEKMRCFQPVTLFLNNIRSHFSTFGICCVECQFPWTTYFTSWTNVVRNLSAHLFCSSNNNTITALSVYSRTECEWTCGSDITRFSSNTPKINTYKLSENLMFKLPARNFIPFTHCEVGAWCLISRSFVPL